MPVFQRKALRQALGRDHLRDTYVGTTALSPNAGVGSLVAVMDAYLADASFSGEQLYQRAWLRVASEEYRVASCNVFSGALLSQQAARAAFASGAEFEVHQKVKPSEKDRALDDVVKRLRLRQEVPLRTVDGAAFYTLAGLGLVRPEDVLDVYYFGNPSGSLDRDQRRFAWFGVVQTATGMELRVDPALGGSAQIVLDAIVTLTLGAGDAATVNIPDERLVLAGAAAKCFDLMIANAPSQEATLLKERRGEKAREFSDLAKSHKVQVARDLEFDRPFSKQTAGAGWWG